jgi:hypothetical protein
MKMKILVSVIVFHVIITLNLFSQTFLQPNFALKSHETLEISKVEIGSQSTSVYLSVENRISGGNFCADKSIFLIYPDGSRLKLTKANFIPVCPDTYNFKSIGEKLDFNLVFPSVRPGTQWIDIIEECDNNCFWFYGITLDNDLNNRLDEAFATASKGKPEDNILIFSNILESIDNQNLGIEGSLYINIITSAEDTGNKAEAAIWYKRFLISHAPRLNLYIKFLNERSIKY